MKNHNVCVTFAKSWQGEKNYQTWRGMVSSFKSKKQALAFAGSLKPTLADAVEAASVPLSGVDPEEVTSDEAVFAYATINYRGSDGWLVELSSGDIMEDYEEVSNG